MRALFTAHPASVGENYFEHLWMSLSFAGRLFLAACACAIHAIFPFLCERTGSTIITTLHDNMVANRDRRHQPR